ncbi:hypothetical protein IP88_05725 [alpha proteobacterium AAP81b]|nr:hypothetical protein IP88_05725 [alpha proteobacterium AAP81b]
MTDAALAALPLPDHAAAVPRLLALLDVEPLELDLFRGQSTKEGWQRVYGGQVVAQALMAATKTVDAMRLCHSLHGYFIRPGDPGAPIVYQVMRDRDGQSFTTRRVVAIQHGRPIFNLAASFQVAEDGLSHAFARPDAPDPMSLRTDAEWARINAPRAPEPHRTIWLTRERPIEYRPVDPLDSLAPVAMPPRTQYWCRMAAPIHVTPAVARAVFAYASDMTLLDTCMLPHAIAWHDPRLQVASLDHAIWFNDTPDLNDFLLFDQDAPVSGGGRGLNRALVYAGSGALVASVMQEGLIRYRPA